MKAKIAASGPSMQSLEAGKTYYWCACGLSNKQPFCDGSHKETGFRPVSFSVEENSKKALCCCKQTANAPYCDGSHKQL
jgi:CDGSH-type Zn-finger protein